MSGAGGGRFADGPAGSDGIRSTWGDGLLIAIAGLILLYGFYVFAHLARTDDVHRVELAWVDGLSAVAALLTLTLLLVLRPDRGGRLVLTAFLASAAGANALAHVHFAQSLVNTVLVVIVLLVVAAGVTSTALATVLVASLWVGWFAVTAGLTADPMWARSLSDLAVATLAASMLHAGRRLTMAKLLRAQAELARLTERDDLTGLLNRRGFFAALREALADAEGGGKRLLVLYCDVDGLKAVNDSRGHEAGDLLLVEVAERLQAEFVDAHCVARLGGDEFGVVLVVEEGYASAVACERARRVRDDADEAVWSLSVGAAGSDELHHVRPAGRTSHDLVGAVVGLADQRMYAAKRERPGLRDSQRP